LRARFLAIAMAHIRSEGARPHLRDGSSLATTRLKIGQRTIGSCAFKLPSPRAEKIGRTSPLEAVIQRPAPEIAQSGVQAEHAQCGRVPDDSGGSLVCSNLQERCDCIEQGLCIKRFAQKGACP
jgi:hypothetical protein